MKLILLFLLVGAVAVLAKKGSSEEDDRVVPFVVYSKPNTKPVIVEYTGSKKGSKRKPSRYPQGRPIQESGSFPMSSFYPQQSAGMMEQMKPFGQSSFSGYPSRYPSRQPGGSNKPNGYPGSGQPGQSPFPGGFQAPSNSQSSSSSHSYSGSMPSSQFPGSQFPGGQPQGGQFPGNQFPGGQPQGGQFPGGQFPGGQPQGGQFPGGQFPGGRPQGGSFFGSSQFPGSQSPNGAQYPGGSQPYLYNGFPLSGYSPLYSVWSYQRPGHGPKPFRGKHHKHHIQGPVYVLGTPEFPFNGPQQYPPQYQQLYYRPQPPQFQPQQPQYQSQRPHFQPQQPQFLPQQQPQFNIPQIAEPVDMTVTGIQQYSDNLRREVEQASARIYLAFQAVDSEIEKNKKSVENSLISEFQSVQLMLEDKQEREIEQAVNNGKDEEKIAECLKAREDSYMKEVEADIARAKECLNDVTERARKMTKNVRNSYTEASVINSMAAKDAAQQMNTCAAQKNDRCVQEQMTLINQGVKSTIEQGNAAVEKVEEAPEKQMIQLSYCRQNFLQDLRELRREFSRIMHKCIESAGSGGKSSSEESKESSEEKKASKSRSKSKEDK